LVAAIRESRGFFSPHFSFTHFLSYGCEKRYIRSHLKCGVSMQPRRAAAPNQPALIPIAGNYDRKPRSIDRDVTTIGRARGTDLCLEANEISTLHCVIYRTADGYRIRDCSSRCGTRINGDTVKTGLLHDGDIVNLGPFSFEFRAPPALFPGDSVRLDPIRVEHWKESRRRLALRAIKMRKRLQGGSPREQEWMQKGHLLKEKIRSYDQRLGELESAEEELTQERQQLAKEIEAHRRHVQSVEHQLSERLAQADQEIRKRWQEFQQRCQVEETRAAGRAPTPPRETLHDGSVPSNQEAVEKHQRMRDLEEQYSRRQEQMQRVQKEFITMKEQWVQDQTTLSTGLEMQQAVLDEKKLVLMRMMGELKKMQEDLRRQAKPDVQALHAEIERLRRENADLRGLASQSDTHALLEENESLRTRVQHLEEQPGDAGQLADLRAEIDLLREELDHKEKALDNLSQHGSQAQSMRTENELLKKLLEEKNLAMDLLVQKTKVAPKSENDLERYETELNEFRRQLETDRAKFNAEVEMLRDRNKELDEAIREMEMEMSKERAELGRERMRLERVREEVKADAERLQRELSVRDSMAPVQKLRDELNGKQAAGKTKSVNDRLRTMRDPLSDGAASGS
jgi:pSer/pThr/pTyr-binding forkhead associated (FHA) protein